MPTFRTAEVTGILSERAGLQRVTIRTDDDQPGDRAYCLSRLTGEVAVGDRVVLNTTAVELGLGTGGWHVVHWNLSRDAVERPGPDHVMKLRYTSLQLDAGTDELGTDLPPDLEGTPVVVCSVHSQVGVVAATLKDRSPGSVVVYVMTDGGALPLALSDLVADLRDRAALDATVTAGHAFGGDLEAVTVPSALLLARHVARADIIVVGMGPGVVGTGTTYGTTALDAAWALDAAARLGGEPVLCVRASDGDGRERHRAVSHHTETIAGFTGAEPWVAPVPPEASSLPGVRTRAVDEADPAEVLATLDLAVTTMGRSMAEDPLFFRSAAAAAAVAVDLLGPA